MKLSIAMAVYNGEHFIQEQLDSYARQSRLPDELVVSDNASVDSTVDIVRDFAERAPFRVGLFVNERNLGVSKNFENAIDKCTGDIIFLSDCDDVWYPDKLKVMEKAFLRWPTAAVATCNADLVDEFLRPAHALAKTRTSVFKSSPRAHSHGPDVSNLSARSRVLYGVQGNIKGSYSSATRWRPSAGLA
jgi:glycosyltransferase involved in cell wall biosynthesis